MKRLKEAKKQYSIKYKDFEKTILDFQLRNHHAFLSRFITLFRAYDPNNFGYINESQFREMVASIDPQRRLDTDKLLEAIDPMEMGVITFSACVALFTVEPITIEGEEPTTILHFISAEQP